MKIQMHDQKYRAIQRDMKMDFDLIFAKILLGIIVIAVTVLFILTIQYGNAPPEKIIEALNLIK